MKWLYHGSRRGRLVFSQVYGMAMLNLAPETFDAPPLGAIIEFYDARNPRSGYDIVGYEGDPDVLDTLRRMTT